MSPLIILLLGSIVGILMGIIGGGGTILAVPIFVYIMDFSPKVAISMSLVIVGVAGLVGVVNYWRKDNIDMRVAFIFGVGAMMGAYVGARAAHFVSETAQMIIFATTMFTASLFMFSNKKNKTIARIATKNTVLLLATEGLLVGILSGLVGVGGGFLIVPTLVIFAGLSMKTAVGTSLLIISMKSVTGFLGYMDQVEVPWYFIAKFSFASALGIMLGSHLAQYISQQALKRSFAIFIFCMSIFIFASNI